MPVPSAEGVAHIGGICSHGDPQADRPVKVIAAVEIFKATGEAIGRPDSCLV